MNQRIRKPAAFRLDDPDIVVTPAIEPSRTAPAVTVPPSGEQTSFDPPAVATAPPRRGAPWAAMFWVSAGGLLLLAMGLGIANLIADLLSRAAWLGGLGMALAAVAAVALIAITTRE